jgi:hypothetical protein
MFRKAATQLVLPSLCALAAAFLPAHAALQAHSAAAALPAVSGGTAAQQNAGVSSAALAQLASSEIATLQETHYTHHGVIDHAAGIYDTDCSGFIDDLLQQIAPDAYGVVPVEHGYTGPRAYIFDRFFAALASSDDQPGWTAVTSLADAQPGDILAWELEPLTPDSDTGHVVVIAETPRANADGTYSVPVDDASLIKHADDSRVAGVGGVGSGTISFRVDGAGAPVAFQFDTHDQFHSTSIAIGRLTDLD